MISIYVCPNCGQSWNKSNQGIYNNKISLSLYNPLDKMFNDCPCCEEDHVINWLAL